MFVFLCFCLRFCLCFCVFVFLFVFLFLKRPENTIKQPKNLDKYNITHNSTPPHTPKTWNGDDKGTKQGVKSVQSLDNDQ